MSDLPQLLAEYPFVHWETIRFRDLDAFGHVNNAVYATYLEAARIAYLLDLTGASLKEIGVILAEQTISYKRPAYFGERLGIGVRVTLFGTKSFTMEYMVARAGDGAIIATGQSVQVAYDYVMERTIPIPETLRAAVVRRQAGRDLSHQGEAGQGV
ncbi:MAG: acyl-CoA thioesterase [Chloroflexaceae bacterium]